MAMKVETLPDDPQALKKIILLQNEKLEDQSKRIDYLLEQFNLARKKQFGASSEAAPGQGQLFNEAEDEAEVEAVEPETNAIAAHTRKKPVRTALPKELPRETKTIDLDDSEKVCDCCNGPLHEMGKETREQLEFIPAQIKVIETVRLKYSCRTCEKAATQTPIKIAPPPASPIPKSIATPSLLAQIIINKYQYALPLYRQETLFKSHNIDLNRKTMADWMIRCGSIVKPIIACLKNHLIEQGVIYADETPLKVIREDKQKSYMWVYCTGTDSPNPEARHKNIVLYDFHPSRAATCPKGFLGDYNGYLQVDGYKAYEQTQAHLVGCMAHARRKFIEAQKAHRSAGRPKGKTGKADWAVNHLQKLYALESKAKTFTSEERYALRQKEAVPLLKQFKDWLDASVLTVTPKSALGAALRYCMNQWNKLNQYVKDGDLNIDNNRAERAIKPFVIGRKNWMFSNTSRGATASAELYSIIETAKANGIEPLKYFQRLLEELPKRKDGDSMEDLMPWNIKC